MSSYHKAKLIANQTSGIHEGVAKVMQLCTEIAEERDELKEYKDNIQRFITGKSTEVRKLRSQLAECREQREELAKVAHPLLEKNKKEVDSIPTEDLKSALVLALCQRDVAFRSVPKVQEISKLLTAWDQGFINDYENFIATCDVGHISDFDVIRHIIDVILKPKKDI